MAWLRGGALALGAGLVLSVSAAQAAVITVTGGDVGQGLTLNPSNVIYAVDFGGGASTTVQGVSFVTSHANVTADGNNGFDPGDPFSGTETSSDDTGLKSIIRSGRFFDFAAGKIIISGLSANTNYQVDLLAAGNGRTMTVAYNNGSVVDSQALSGSTAYNYSNVATSAGDGTLVVNMNVTEGFANSVFSAVVVSNPVPEPATVAVVAIGAMGLMARRRRA